MKPKFKCRFCGGKEFVQSTNDGRGFCGKCQAFGSREALNKQENTDEKG